MSLRHISGYLAPNYQVQLSLLQGWDDYFDLPDIIACFIERARNEASGLGVPFEVKPQTILRRVALFVRGKRRDSIPYETIEDNIVQCLDRFTEEVEAHRATNCKGG